MEIERIDGLDDLLDRFLTGGRSTHQRQRPEFHGPRHTRIMLPVDQQLQAMRRREERLRAANAPPPEPGIVEKAVGTIAAVAVAVTDTVTAVLPLVGKARAVAFLREHLAGGARPAAQMERLAREAGISATALRRGRNALKIKPQKVGNAWFWSLPAGS